MPTRTTVRDREVEIDYDVEEADGQVRGVARLRLPEKVARSLTEGIGAPAAKVSARDLDVLSRAFAKRS